MKLRISITKKKISSYVRTYNTTSLCIMNGITAIHSVFTSWRATVAEIVGGMGHRNGLRRQSACAKLGMAKV